MTENRGHQPAPAAAAAAAVPHDGTLSAANQGNQPLTARQMEIVRLIAEGRSNKEIAAHLFLSIDAVKHHVMRACRRWNVSNRTALAAAWLKPKGEGERQ